MDPKSIVSDNVNVKNLSQECKICEKLQTVEKILTHGVFLCKSCKSKRTKMHEHEYTEDKVYSRVMLKVVYCVDTMEGYKTKEEKTEKKYFKIPKSIFSAKDFDINNTLINDKYWNFFHIESYSYYGQCISYTIEKVKLVHVLRTLLK